MSADAAPDAPRRPISAPWARARGPSDAATPLGAAVLPPAEARDDAGIGLQQAARAI